MFEKFKELFSSENLLDSAFNTTLKMIEYDYKMFEAARVTLRESDTDKLPFDLRKMDRKINRYERLVRRQVLTHLTIAGTQNLPPGLALVSIVIDVERIGDYTKNIAELANMHKMRLNGGQHENTLATIEKANSEAFPIILKILNSQEKEQARGIMRAGSEIGKMADSIITHMVLSEDEGMTTSDTVCLCLYTRFLKRINAHLVNIVSSIVNPFPRIGFREKNK